MVLPFTFHQPSKHPFFGERSKFQFHRRHDTNVGLLRFFSETAAKRSFRFQQVGRDQISSLENLEAKMELLKIGGAKLCWVSCADLNKAQLSEWSQACQSAGALLVMDASFCPDANWELPGGLGKQNVRHFNLSLCKGKTTRWFKEGCFSASAG